MPILLSLKMTNEVTLGENVEALKAKAENVCFFLMVKNSQIHLCLIHFV